MDDRLARLESAVATLTDQVRYLEYRLAGLEGARDGAPDERHPRTAAPPAADFTNAPVQQWLALAGRTLVVLGGAYLLRALTDSHVLSARIGVALGLLYGAPWLVLAARAGGRGANLDALCHALATALIGYPLVWEATVRFGVLQPGQSAAVLGALTAAALVLAVVARLHSLAWVVTFGALGSAAGLGFVTRDWNSYTLLTIAVGLGTLWLGYVRSWGDVRWLAAAGANLMLLIATGRGAVSHAPEAALALQVLMFVGYVGTFAVRTLAGTHRIGAFDVAQTIAAAAIALAGSVFLTAGPTTLVIGIAVLLLGGILYVMDFRFVRLNRDAATSFFWSSFALVLTLVGVAVCLAGNVAAMVYGGGAAALALAARSRGSLTLNLHASVYAIAAAAASSLVAHATLALVLPPAAGWLPLNPSAQTALAALALLVLTPVRSPVESWTTAARIPRLFVVCLLVWTAMGAAVLLATLPLADPRRMDPSVLATLRTAILVAATLVVARVARYESGREAGWLTYPLLVVTGMKLVFFDLPIGRPQTLFAAMALYGFALIVAPRLLRGVSESAGSVGASRLAVR